MFHCAIVNDISTNPLPPPHPELLKFFEPPKRVVKRAKNAVEECKAAFKVKEVPKRVAKAKKDGHAHAEDEDDNMMLLDRKRPPTQSQINVVKSSPGKGKAPANVENSDTEEDEEEELLLDKKKPTTPPASRRTGGPLLTPARSVSPEIDPGRAPGKIIGTTYPLKDFQKNIAQGDVVSKAVEDLSAVILEVVMKPFASRRHKEMLECMKALRKTCLEEDEVDAWNTFIRELKEKCMAKPGNLKFWKEVRENDKGLGLISKEEAGVECHVTQSEAEEFFAS